MAAASAVSAVRQCVQRNMRGNGHLLTALSQSNQAACSRERPPLSKSCIVAAMSVVHLRQQQLIAPVYALLGAVLASLPADSLIGVLTTESKWNRHNCREPLSVAAAC